MRNPIRTLQIEIESYEEQLFSYKRLRNSFTEDNKQTKNIDLMIYHYSELITEYETAIKKLSE